MLAHAIILLHASIVGLYSEYKSSQERLIYGR